MFKLVKITGARINVPELAVVDIDGTSPYFFGCCYYFTQGTVLSYPTNEDDLKFIALEEIPQNSGKKTLLGYFVTENMVFETEIYNDHTKVKVGDSLLLYSNTLGHSIGADAEVGYDMKLLNKDEAATTGKVLVALKW